jgi:hypothetical protein
MRAKSRRRNNNRWIAARATELCYRLPRQAPYPTLR